MNETVRDYCQAAGIAFTRCRPYCKNDQAFVEQKNGAVVRRIVGYRRLEGWAAAAALARLYATVWLFVNFFQPSFKLAGKEREGARVRKRYHPPATPCERLLADPRTPEAVRGRVEALRATLDPVRLLNEMRAAQQALVTLADQDADRPAVVDAPSIDRGSDHVSVPPSQRRDGRRCRLQASCRRRAPRHPPTRPDPDASAGLDDRARGRLPPACLLSSALDRKLG